MTPILVGTFRRQARPRRPRKTPLVAAVETHAEGKPVRLKRVGDSFCSPQCRLLPSGAKPGVRGRQRWSLPVSLPLPTRMFASGRQNRSGAPRHDADLQMGQPQRWGISRLPWWDLPRQSTRNTCRVTGEFEYRFNPAIRSRRDACHDSSGLPVRTPPMPYRLPSCPKCMLEQVGIARESRLSMVRNQVSI